MRIARIVLAAAALFSLADPGRSSATALPPEIRPTAMVVAGPEGWQRMCARHPAWCAAAPTGSVVELNAAMRTLVRSIQREVNLAIRPLDEPAGQDEWLLAPAAGDCEDYALTKRVRLIAAGIPAGSVYFAVVLTERDELHTVLFLNTTEGIRVLDNRLRDPVAWPVLRDRGGYRLLMVEVPGSGGWRVTDDGLALALQGMLFPAGGEGATGSIRATER